VAGTAFALALPTIYRSTASLLVESQDLPTTLVESPTTGAVDQRLARIREQVLSRADLIQLIEQNNLYPEERRSKPMSQIIETMRHSTSVSASRGNLGEQSGASATTIAIAMSFDYPEPGKAQAVLQSFVSKFLTMDSANVEDQASLSVRFLQDQANKLQGQIAQIEGQLTGLKARNGSALASSGIPPMIDTGSFSAQITALQNENRQLVAQSRRPVERGGPLAAAEAALASAQAQYSDSHPDVVQARERLRQLRQITPQAPDESRTFQDQIAANNAAIQSLMGQRDAALARASSAMAGSSRAPAIMEQAMQMENRASTLRAQYQQISESLLKAQNSSRMASEQRAERLSLVEPATLPDSPHSPNRPLLIAASAGAGLLAGLLLALLLELVSKPIRSPRQLESLGLPILGVVPLLKNKQRRAYRSLFRWQEKRIGA
jgi:uncharacterized protein involved in exopolysaccharide biosynthesis